MSNPELFKYDVRVRERMLKSKLLSEEQVRSHLEALPDAGDRCEDVTAQQPALARHEAERAEPVRRPVLFGVPIPMAPRAPTAEPRVVEPRAGEPAPAEGPVNAAPVDDEDEDDEDEDDEDEDDEDDEDEPEDAGSES